jgi:proteasome assembly chaperone (PAC2) family protein
LRGYNVVLRDKIQISGLNGLLLGVAQERGIDGICLLGEVPFYIAQMQIEYPKSSQAVLRVLTRMLEVEIDMREMDYLVSSSEQKISELEQEVAKKMGQIVIRPRGVEEQAEESGGKEEVSESVRHKIEHLFQEAEEDSSRAVELKAELDEWGLFSEYEDRFLDIFKRRS